MKAKFMIVLVVCMNIPAISQLIEKKTVHFADGTSFTYGGYGTILLSTPGTGTWKPSTSPADYTKPAWQRRADRRSKRYEKRSAYYKKLIDAYDNPRKSYDSLNAAAISFYESGNYNAADSLFSIIPIHGTPFNWELYYKAQFYRLVRAYALNDYSEITDAYINVFGIYMIDPLNAYANNARKNLNMYDKFQLEVFYTIALCNTKSKTEAYNYWNKAFPYFYPQLVAKSTPEVREDANLLVADVLSECGKPEKSIAFLERIIKSAPNKSVARKQACDFLFNDYSDPGVRDYLLMQLDTLERNLDLTSDNNYAQSLYLKKAQVLCEAARYEEALNYTRKLNLNNDFKLAGIYVAAQCYLKKSDYQQCLNLLKNESLFTNKNNGAGRNFLFEEMLKGDAEMGINKPAEALGNYNEAQKLIENNTSATPANKVMLNVKKAFALLDLKQEQQALDLMENTINQYSNQAYPYVFIGNVYLGKNNKRKAASYFAKAKELGYNLTSEQLSTL